jgi:small-conductance mechanosensitive channel
LKDGEDELRERGTTISRLNELYVSISSSLSNVQRKVGGIIIELKSKAQWVGVARPLWKGLTTFIPDISRFLSDLQSVVLNTENLFQGNNIQTWVNHYTQNGYALLALVLQLLIVCITFVLIKVYLPDFKNFIQSMGSKYGVGNKIMSFIAASLGFVKDYLLGLFIWACALIIVRQGLFNPYIGMLFYIASIPYMLFYVYKYVSYISQVNADNDHMYISEDYHDRFFGVLSFFLSSTVTILLFRQAFLLGNYDKSDVSTVLLAINFFILQLSVILLISRDQILSLIPRKTSFLKSLHEFIDEYYYLFLVLVLSIIFVSNPYIGFGPQVFSIISRIIIIALLVPAMSMVHSYIKTFSQKIFFKRKADVTRERFKSAKTFYGMFIILSFIGLVFLGGIVAANVIGYGIGYEQLTGWLNMKLFDSGVFTAAGRPVPVTPLSLLKVFMFVGLGIVAAYLINRFILRRMFELLLVNIGIQTALMSLTKYVVILAFFVIGLQAAGLSTTSMLLYLLAIIGGVGFAAKEFITDVLSYFVILVQRPLKIGDLVQISPEVIGVVRHITLRSIIIRKKNSVTIIIPNSHVVTKPIVNWNYSPTFFAFNDIYLQVPYFVDPEFVKTLVKEVLDSNINVLKSPAPIIWLSNYASSGFEFTIRGYLSPDKVLEGWEINSQVRFQLAKKLKENGIEFASPTTNVYFVNRQNKGGSPGGGAQTDQSQSHTHINEQQSPEEYDKDTQ